MMYTKRNYKIKLSLILILTSCYQCFSWDSDLVYSQKLPNNLKEIQKEFLHGFPKLNESSKDYEKEQQEYITKMKQKIILATELIYLDSVNRVEHFARLSMVARDGFFGIAGFQGNEKLPSLMLAYGIDSCSVEEFKIRMTFIDHTSIDSIYCIKACSKNCNIDVLEKEAEMKELNKTLNNKKHGWWVERFNNGKIKSIGEYKKGKKVGKWKERDYSNLDWNEGLYKKGKEVGYWFYISSFRNTKIKAFLYRRGKYKGTFPFIWEDPQHRTAPHNTRIN